MVSKEVNTSRDACVGVSSACRRCHCWQPGELAPIGGLAEQKGCSCSPAVSMMLHQPSVDSSAGSTLNLTYGGVSLLGDRAGLCSFSYLCRPIGC